MAVDLASYPRPRTARAGPAPTTFAPAEPGTIVTPPTVSALTFQIGTVAGTRSTRSSRRLFGPAILRSWHFTLGGPATGSQALEFGVSTVSITEDDVSRDSARGWRPLLESMSVGADGNIAGRVGLIEPDFASGVTSSQQNANIPIIDTEFFLTVTNWSSASADVFAGHVIIAERVAPEVLANFL